MSDRESAEHALRDLLWELPMEFLETDTQRTRESFHVIKKRNVRNVHVALIELQRYFGLLPDPALDNQGAPVIE